MERFPENRQWWKLEKFFPYPLVIMNQADILSKAQGHIRYKYSYIGSLEMLCCCHSSMEWKLRDCTHLHKCLLLGPKKDKYISDRHCIFHNTILQTHRVWKWRLTQAVMPCLLLMVLTQNLDWNLLLQLILTMMDYTSCAFLAIKLHRMMEK